MHKTLKTGEHQLQILASQAKVENSNCGPLYKRNVESTRWQLRWFALQYNILYCFEMEGSQKVVGYTILEGCYAEEIVLPPVKERKQYGFAIYLIKDQSKLYDLRADTEMELRMWLDCVNGARYSKLQESKEQLEQKHIHLQQVLQAESHAKWHSMRQIEELIDENKKLKSELKKHKSELVNEQKKDSPHLRKIKKPLESYTTPVTEEMVARVQSFFRGWLCRRRWKQIVELYIKSPHAESMRTRNNVVFSMVEDEEEYVKNLSILVTCFLRPLKMAASSKKPLINHDDVNSIFLNSETVLFLHQIFLKGLTARMDNWPTLVIGDLFDMLLPMLGIYQEYVRNHHYSLQVLAEYKQKPEFSHLLKRFEEKPTCENRVLETFLTYPMHQIPKYILALHELLAHTPYDHVERNKLEYAKGKLEELSLVMYDEVSETENIRKNLAIERMITEGCDILLDTSQVFVRQGNLLQVAHEKTKHGGRRLAGLSSTFKDRGVARRVLLFTQHLLIANRMSNGRLHLAKHCGKLPLAQCTLIEDTGQDPLNLFEDEGGVMSSGDGNSSSSASGGSGSWGLDFRIVIHAKDKENPPTSFTFVASSLQEKTAWCSDISQCMENLHYTDTLSDCPTSSLPQSVRADHKLIKDDLSVRYCRRAPSSCMVPQIRHATVDKLLERLTDLRFLSIDFLNTFLLTYKVFTDSETVLDSLRTTIINHCAARKAEHSIADNNGEQDSTQSKQSTGSGKAAGEDQQAAISSQLIIDDNANDLLTGDLHEAKGSECGLFVNKCDEERATPNQSSKDSLSTERRTSSSSSSTSTSDGGKDPVDNVFVNTSNLPDQTAMRKSNGQQHADLARSLALPKVSCPARPVVLSHKHLEGIPMTGAVITSSRVSRRRCSSSAATSAFAAATAGAPISPSILHSATLQASVNKTTSSEVSTAILRALNVFRHWVSKYPQNFRKDDVLSRAVSRFLEELVISYSLASPEQKLASSILKTLNKELEQHNACENLKHILYSYEDQKPSSHPSFESAAAIDIAEQLTYLDHQIFMSISTEELLSQAWMKADKMVKAPHVIQASQRFNEVSRLVVTEIVTRTNINERVSCIEKWSAIGDILHCMHNFNGVLEICSAFVNSSIYRLNKTWHLLSKQTKQTISKLQTVVSSDGRFKNMREAMSRCDGACVPYLGMYLSDLSYIEEGSPNFVEDNLVNFSKMKMVANVIREVQQYQQQVYAVSYDPHVCGYLLDRSRLLNDEQAYQRSLAIEPRNAKTSKISSEVATS